MRLLHRIPALLHTTVRTLLQALMYALVASFVLDTVTALTRRRSIAAAHHAVTHFGDHHTQ
ncbi:MULTISPECIES: hypothetical protein [Nocardia]|uniref:hypothetical protein n=1 Tax=Nocardia TaxID=1817 RepID=UPI0002D72750|nr:MULTISPECIES: hypothetical protein [Nocardia]